MRVLKTIYKTKGSEQAVLELYEEQLSKLGCVFQDILLHTS
ncbi:hypothetical protein CLOSTMETH_02597 [[Clostridium] methylpentosum DSM 5476]|jgi:hypothetical protein|uniref:Uncharacterized protein n=1 Tax=[Clostridium] methylpentosum DSM 5476 TaxID=537013 RepID=C0EFF5_9FIRM|nr:hypothetical protein CLOSTMETH_02597 [[Clostridium] methylpentosum DSM 5476]